MRIFRKGVKRGVVMLAEKTFNLLVVLALLLQPVGTVGLYGAFSFSQGVAVAADEEPTSTDVVEPQAEPAPSKETVKEEVSPVEEVIPAVVDEEKSVGETKESEEPVVVSEEMLPSAPVLPAPEFMVPAVEETLVSEEEAPETPVLTEEPALLEGEIPDESEEEERAVWEVNAHGNKATTTTDVVVGQKYVAPQNDQVTVTFTKLPEQSGTLSIEEVKLSDEQVATLGAFSHTAYDVTSSMEDGTFEYTLTLPIPKDQKNVKVKYTEDVTTLDQTRDVSEKDVDRHTDSVSVSLDHFTLFVATYGDVAFSVDKSQYFPGDTVYVKGEGLNDTLYYRMALNPPVGSLIYLNSCFNPADGVTTMTDSKVLEADAVISSGWAGELKEYTTSNCTGEHTDVSDPFAVVTPPPATGNLKAVKVVDDQSDLTQWSFQLDNDAPIFANASGEVDFGQVLVGEHTIIEAGPVSYSLTNVSGTGCALVPTTTGATAQVADNGVTVCTFSNAVDRGSITIVKDAQPNSMQDFAFMTTGLETTSFVLDDDSDNENGVSNSQTFSNLLPGTYSFTENVVTGWALQELNCVTSQEVSLDIPLGQTATLELTPGVNITCTYTNVLSAYCGDDIVNQEGEECDGTVDGGAYSCSQDCHLVPNPGVLHVTKEVVNDDGGMATASGFTFSINSESAVAFEADGTNDVVLPAGVYTVTEPAPLGYTVSYSKGCENIDLSAGGDAYCTITNDDAPVTVTASKVICTAEADLPNWGNGGPDITSTTASDWVASHSGCHLKRDWSFQWSYDGVPNPGNNTGEAGSEWHTFVGNDVVPIVSGPEQNIWVREVWSDGYIPFTYGNNPEDVNGDNVSAEFYCHQDVVNYDNWDKITNPVAGEAYFCVGWNVEKPGRIIVKKQTDPAGSMQEFSFSASFTEGDFSLTDGQSYESGDLVSGTYSVTEAPLTGWKQEGAICSDGSKPGAIVLDPGETVTCVFKNQETAHIVATKIVCDTEADLPNYGLGGPDMTETSAIDWVNTHESCHFKKDWQFQWAYYSDANPGDNTGESLDPVWHTFGPTGVNGQTSTDVDLKSSSKVWVREVWSDGYIPFTYGNNPEDVNGDNVSAEFYCHQDVVNYDNYDYIDGVENAPAYYCVAWNVAKRGTITIVKDATPEDPQDFTFVGDLGQFALDDDGDTENELSNSKTFSDLLPETYTVSEVLPEGWQYSGAECVYGEESVGVSVENGKEIVLGAGDDITCTFHNSKNPVTVVASKIVCNDEADLPNYGEGGPDLTATTASDWVATHESCRLEPNWQFQWSLDDIGNPGDNGGASESADWHTFGPTGIDGTTTVNIVEPATSRLWFREVLKEGYIPFTRDENNDNSNDVTAEFYCNTDVVNYDNWDWIDTLPNQTYYCVAWNVPDQEQVVSQLLLRKTNDSVSDETPGNEVVYTLTVTALGGPVDDVTVTDLPPEGFEYVAGSGAGAPFVHEYASPGIWDLGDMSAGETKTLTYKTTISGAQDAGLYTDLAFAKGMNGESIVYANSEADPFVGTDVNVVLPDTQIVTVPEERDNDRVIKRKTKTQYVLGASTILPMTGVSALPLAVAVAGLILGGGLLFLARRKMSLPVAVVLAVMGGALWLPGQASAGSLSVNIETPESMVTTPDFQIGFVTLDVLSRPLTVECYKTGVATPFATYALASSFGGNSGNCQVNATIMPSDGTYTFYVKAIASGEGSDSIESSPVSVTLASVPGTPYNYSRTDTACQHTIGFTTANDGGKTVKVVLYRSASTTFTADASTKVDEQAVGSSVTGSFVEGAPGCSDDWFYALQAVDVNGNGSAFVGDVNVTVRKYTVTHRKTKTVTLPGGTSTAPAIAVAPGTSGVGEVQGAETVNETEATVSGEKEERGAGSVLGEMSEATGEDDESGFDLFKNHPWRSLFIAFILLLLGYYGYQYSQKKRYDQSAE